MGGGGLGVRGLSERGGGGPLIGFIVWGFWRTRVGTCEWKSTRVLDALVVNRGCAGGTSNDILFR